MSNLYSLKPRERNPVLPPFDQPEAEDPVVILYRTEDDRMACSASIGGEPDNGYFCIYAAIGKALSPWSNACSTHLSGGIQPSLLKRPQRAEIAWKNKIFKFVRGRGISLEPA